MIRNVEKCTGILSEMSKMQGEEYKDSLMDLAVQLRALVERTLSEKAMTEDLLLCYHQITTCLNFMASGSKVVLSYFETRIRVCLDKVMESLTSSTEEKTETAPESVMTAIDSVLDLLDDKEILNYSSSSRVENDSSSLIESVIDAVNYLLSQVLFFRSIAMREDQGRISDMCRCILAKKLALADWQKDPLAQPRLAGLLLGDLRRSILELEDLLSSSLLHLFVNVMMQLQENPLDKVIEKMATNMSNDSSSTHEFDLLMERLIQLGVLAIGSTDNATVKSYLRSAVASLESLDNHLLPMLLVQSQSQATTSELKKSIGPLQRHWSEETTKLGINIHKIIDSKAFSTCLVEWVSERLDRTKGEATEGQEKCTTTAALCDVLQMCLVFHQHLCLNGIGGDGETAAEEEEGKATSTGLGQHRKDLRIMLNECKAVLKYADQVDRARIFKRFRLLLHVLRKIHQDMPVDGDAEEEEKSSPVQSVVNTQQVECSADDFDESTEYFMSFGISVATPASRVLYRKRSAKNSDSMIPQAQFSGMSRGRGSTRIRPGHVFRRDLSATIECGVEETMHLNITEILEQLDQLPRTFSE